MKTQKLALALLVSVVSALLLEFQNVHTYFNLDFRRFAKLLFFGLSGQWAEAPVFYGEFVFQFAFLFVDLLLITMFFVVERRRS